MKRTSVSLRHPVRLYMTPSPHVIGPSNSLEEAEAIMRQQGIRHLPVVEDGRLVGMLSERDLYALRALRKADAATRATFTVEPAMTPDVYAVTPETPLDEVAATMASHKYGSAVVFRGSVVVGIFTATDALGLLVKELRGAA